MIQNFVSSGGPSVEQGTPTIEVSTSGLITAKVTQASGLVTGGTKSVTKQLTTQSGKTITPRTSQQTAVYSGRYTTGNIYVAGDSDLKPENIKEGVNIFGVNGTLSSGYDVCTFAYGDDLSASKNYLSTTTASKLCVNVSNIKINNTPWSEQPDILGLAGAFFANDRAYSNKCVYAIQLGSTGGEGDTTSGRLYLDQGAWRSNTHFGPANARCNVNKSANTIEFEIYNSRDPSGSGGSKADFDVSNKESYWLLSLSFYTTVL